MAIGSRILPRLYQGPIVAALPPAFTMIVFCAEEVQPSDERCRPLRVVRCPLQDDDSQPLAASVLRRAMDAAAIVRAEHQRGGRVYVSCQMGINRSGLVMALAVRDIIGGSGREALRWVQLQRPGSLSNQRFCEALERLGAPTMRPPAFG